jgi:hypothetical protein
VLHLSGSSLLVTATHRSVSNASLLLFLVVVVLVRARVVVLASRNPETALAVLHGSILTGKVDGLTLVAVATALRQIAGAGRELRRDGSVLLDPVGQRVFAVLDDAARGQH